VAKWTAAGDAGPKGPGWVVQVSGHHYHNDAAQKPLVEMQFVRETLADGLLGRLEDVPVAAGPLAGKLVPPADLGIGYPVIVSSPPISIERVAGLVLPGAEGANETPAAGPATGNATGFPPRWLRWLPDHASARLDGARLDGARLDGARLDAAGDDGVGRDGRGRGRHATAAAGLHPAVHLAAGCPRGAEASR
jgi:hypothetical protein